MNFTLILLLFSVFISKCLFSDGASAESSTILPQIGGSYVFMFRKNGITPQECYIEDSKKHTYKIDIHQTGLRPEQLNSTKNLISDESDVITSLGNELCGFKMDKVSIKTQSDWKLILIDNEDKTHTLSAQIIPKKNKFFHKKFVLSVGDPLFIECKNVDFTYCRLLHPNGLLLTSGTQSCTYELKITKLNDFGTWKCLVNYENSMEETELIFEYIKTVQDQITVWQNETDDHLNLGCSVKNPKEVFDYCLMVRPDGKQFKLIPELATERYTAFYTNQSSAFCSLQIMKPLEDNEKGLWRCEQYYVLAKPLGGFLNVSGANKITEADIPKRIIVQENATLTATCRVPYSSTYCYMKGPDGTIYPVPDDRSTTLGLCEFTKLNIQSNDNGIWYCGFGRSIGEPDELHQFEVLVLEVPYIKSESFSYLSKIDESITLKCSTKGLSDYPLKYCRFRSPDGKIYQIGNHETSDRISYEGKGLEYGDCGIKIKSVQESDEGIWSCITRIGSNFEQDDERYLNIHLTIKQNLSVASIFGITFGAILILILTSIYFLNGWIKRRTGTNFSNFLSFRRGRTSVSSSSSSQEGSVINFSAANIEAINSNTPNYSSIENINVSYHVNNNNNNTNN